MNIDLASLCMPWINALGLALLDFLWQGVLIGISTWVLLRLLKQHDPVTRYLVGCSAMLGALSLTIYSAFSYYLSQSSADSATLFNVGRSANQIDAMNLPWMWQWIHQQLLSVVMFWAICVSLLLIRFVAGMFWVRQISRADHGASHFILDRQVMQFSAKLRIHRPIRMRVLDNIQTPFTIGWWKPVVLVPASLVTGLPSDLLKALIAHEIAHVYRMDYVINLIQPPQATVTE